MRLFDGGRILTNHSMSRRSELLRAALGHLQAALDLVDQASAPGQIGAHIDLAVNQLADTIASPGIAEAGHPAEHAARH